MCFFVLCKRHWINRVPGAHRGDSLCILFHLNSDAGYAVVPLTLLGAPVNRCRKGLGRPYGLSLDVTLVHVRPSV